MEDEEYYHMMLEDMERLERVHHHVSHPSGYQQPDQSSHTHSPLISGLRLAINSAFKSGIERLQAVSLPNPTRSIGRRGSASSTRTSSSSGSERL
ncbi:hypothetical protein QBC40DRAFT_277076 [Triangularia verruculosa]|uniref:Uncharacterized protein n=1 Tax=Triangularia verruculosa TaxID=2587418 RepID=A0AAN7AX44_9PEZI|nr:hypothetical protein QBC40DRAFT_277076 [Triangularia verruculosa]